MEKTLKNWIEKILMGAAFAFYFFVTCYRLTNASLWFDEAVEFWYSRTFSGQLPFWESTTTNMYQRIISTYQPPLYNILMYFWLQISTSEWWFRFFGVVMGFVGNIAIYKTVKKIGNGLGAAIAVFLSSCTYRLVYYWQECAEYCLMLCSLCWTIYFFLLVLEEQSKKRIILFTISAVIPIYSQYGAVFPIFSMLLVFFIFICIRKEKTAIITTTAAYIIAFVCAGIPLVFLFLRKQMERQLGGEIIGHVPVFRGGPLRDCVRNFLATLRWNLFTEFSDRNSLIIAGILLLLTTAVIILSKNVHVRVLVIINIFTWLLFYIAVKVKLYANTEYIEGFGNRYSLFFIPLWIITIFAVVFEFSRILWEKFPKHFEYSCCFLGICVCFVSVYIYLNWTQELAGNWQKENMRGAVEKWFDSTEADSNTLVYRGGAPAFAYYLHQANDFDPDMERNIKYMKWLRDLSKEEYIQVINNMYNYKWPEEILFIGSHVADDFDTIVSIFTDAGYNSEKLFTSNAYLMRFTLPSDDR